MNEKCNNTYTGKLQAVIFDWSGTTVDFGCFASARVFIEVFRLKGIEITMAEARGPMGMEKCHHIRLIALYPRVAAQWKALYGRECNEQDIEEMFKIYMPIQLSLIEKYSALIPGLREALKVVRSMDMKIGSTTSYNKEIMEKLTNSATRQGYTADSVVCSDDVSEGRPAPYMAHKNAENLGISHMQACLKIGDTIPDIKEGKNAGMWSVGVVISGNKMGLSPLELCSIESEELEIRKQLVKKDYFDAGADYVISSLAELKELIYNINQRLAVGEKPAV
jgi:phosphonoacetaldehyde hydrolase